MKNKTILSFAILAIFILMIGGVFATDEGVDTTDDSNYLDDSLVVSNNFKENVDYSQSDSTSLEADNITMYYKDGTVYVVKLVDSNNNPIVGRNLTLNINGVDYYRLSDSNGEARLNINLLPGTYSIYSSFDGDSQYTPSKCLTTITVLSTIISEDLVKFYKNDTQFDVIFLDKKGNLLINADVILSINGKSYYRTTNESGVARLNINLMPGVYVIDSYNVKTDEHAINNVFVITVATHDLVKYYQNGSQFIAKFCSIYGDILVDTNVIFSINGKNYIKTTNESGEAKLNINLDLGDYLITTFNPVTGEEVINNIKVLPPIISSDLVKEYRNNSQFSVKIVDINNNPLSGANVKLEINGVNYTRVTNDLGIATLNINLLPGEYSIITYYDRFNVTNQISVLTAAVNLTTSDYVAFFNNQSDFEAKLTYTNGEPIINQPLIFTINGVSTIVYTDQEGKAYLPFAMNLGEYLISTEFNQLGFENKYVENQVLIVDSYCIFVSDDLVIEYKTGAFKVQLINVFSKEPLANQSVVFTINGVSYSKITDENGFAALNINLLPGVYPISFEYSTPGALDYAHGDKTITVTKRLANIVSEDLVMYYKEKAYFEATVLDKNNIPLTNLSTVLSINGVDYYKFTDENGKVRLNINLITGVYEITTTVMDAFYTGSKLNYVIVNGTICNAEDMSFEYGTVNNFPIEIVDPLDNPVSGIAVDFTIEGKTQTVLTDSNGIANAVIEGYDYGVYLIKYSYHDFNGDLREGANYITIHEPVTIEDIIGLSISARDYIALNGKLPESFTIDDKTFNSGTFLYLVCESLIQINASNDTIKFNEIGNPKNPGKSANMGNLYDYLAVCQVYIDFADKNGYAANYYDSEVGVIGYDGVFYALVRALAYYGEEGILPEYTSVKSTELPVFPGVLNDLNTITDLAPYLEPTKNCQVNDPEIQALAARLTAGLTSDLAKATAIYNYVRDQVSYSFYYDTHYGATGTLHVKFGNCCDQAQLLVALSRAADLPARFKHGTCTFSSGTYGHVWAQILIGNTWVVADPTSNRNSFGVVNNWNNYQYSLHSTYISLPF